MQSYTDPTLGDRKREDSRCKWPSFRALQKSKSGLVGSGEMALCRHGVATGVSVHRSRITVFKKDAKSASLQGLQKLQRGSRAGELALSCAQLSHWRPTHHCLPQLLQNCDMMVRRQASLLLDLPQGTEGHFRNP